jgi:DNA uptake protein ComE-like DNA-binding protein
VRALRSATARELAEVPGISEPLAQQVIDHLNREPW